MSTASTGGGLIEEETAKIVGYPLLTLIVGWIVRALVARLSRDGVDRAKDRAEIDFVKTLREENQMLRTAAAAAYKERDEAISRESAAVSQLGGLQSEVRHLTKQVEFLNARVDELVADRGHRTKHQGSD